MLIIRLMPVFYFTVKEFEYSRLLLVPFGHNLNNINSLIYAKN